MFYNGADRDARWRIGWAEFDSCFTKTVRRCEEPLITPPPEPKNPEDTDIAFAASTIEDGKTIRLYYTIADRLIRCALIVKR
jgi:predicted GH43/DUF377 family glycosyl hydrolase